MKLQDKETGEIGYLQFDVVVQRIRVVDVNNDTVGEYKSLAELNEEWEDYEEPDEIWYIDWKGDIRSADIDNDWVGEKQIGNYFETKEESEEAVEKLKAWKRLRDKGFRFTVWGCGLDDELTIKAKYSGLDIYEDMNLLFGGEE